MTLETIVGTSKLRQDPNNPCMVQIQRGHGTRWVDYAPRDTPKEAKELIWKIAQGEIDPWLHTGNDTNEIKATRVRRKR